MTGKEIEAQGFEQAAPGQGGALPGTHMENEGKALVSSFGLPGHGPRPAAVIKLHAGGCGSNSGGEHLDPF